MLILRNLLLLAIAALGTNLAVDTLTHHSFRIEITAGIGLFAAAMVAAVLIFLAIRKQRLPFRSWYILPVIIGTGVGLLAGYHFEGRLLSELGAAYLGTGAALVCFSALQIWADLQGQRDWYGLLAITGVLFLVGVIGLVSWHSG